ncbi:MAG: DUF1629 domain-containing protein [Pseudomonadota bacterium]
MVHVLITMSDIHVKRGDLREWQDAHPDGEERAGIARHWQVGDGALDPNDAPKALHFLEEKVPDVFTSMDRVLIVREAIRDVIEGFDPGIHQFLPLDLNGGENREHPEPYYLMVVSNTQDTIVDALTDSETPSSDPSGTCDAMFLTSITRRVKVTVDHARLGALNLWREERYRRTLMMSDALHDAFRHKGLEFFSSFAAEDFIDAKSA